MRARMEWLRRVDRWTPVIAGILACLIYELTNARGLFWGDSGEFLAAAHTLGIGHAYGHPLFWLAGRVAILLLPGNPAAAMNLLTVLTSGAAVAVVAMLARDVCGKSRPVLDRILAVLTVSGVYAFAATIWTQATFIEVYNFQALFLALALYFLNRYISIQSNPFCLFASAYFFGVAVTLGFYVLSVLIVPFLLLLLPRSRCGIRVSHLSGALLLFAAGLSLWIYLPVRSGADPVFTLQKIHSFSDFIRYLGREQFETLGVAGIHAAGVSVSETVKIVMANAGLFGMILILAGIWMIARDRNNRPLLVYLVSSLILFIVFTLLIPMNLTFRQMVDMDVYFIPALLVLVPFLALGACQLLQWLKGPLRFVLIIPVVVLTAFRWGDQDISRNTLPGEFSAYLTENLPAGSRLLLQSDEVAHPLLYHLYGVKIRDDFNILMKENMSLDSLVFDQAAGDSSLFIEINDSFLNTFFPRDTFLLAGPFIAFPGDTTAARSLEAEFARRFDPENLHLDSMNRLDRMSMARLWARRGVFWFHMYRKYSGHPENGSYYGRAVNALQKAFLLDDFSLEGALHASNLAQAFMNMEDAEEARVYAERALDLNSKSPGAHRVLYNMAVKEKDYKTALIHLKQLSRVTPGDGQVFMNMALIHYLLKQDNRARDAYETGIQKGAPDHPELKARLFPDEQ
jgi:tetratricopeptide (TPR) repeat protein